MSSRQDGVVGHLAHLAHRSENRLDMFAEEIAAEHVDYSLCALGVFFEKFTGELLYDLRLF